MYEQVGSDICQDITAAASEGGFKDTFYPAAIQNFTVEGKMRSEARTSGPCISTPRFS
jgi:hypothetical protein